MYLRQLANWLIISSINVPNFSSKQLPPNQFITNDTKNKHLHFLQHEFVKGVGV